MKRIDDRRQRQATRSGLPMYLAFAAVLGLLWLERRASLTPTDHTITLLSIVAIFFVVTWIWLGAEGTK